MSDLYAHDEKSWNVWLAVARSFLAGRLTNPVVAPEPRGGAGGGLDRAARAAEEIAPKATGDAELLTGDWSPLGSPQTKPVYNPSGTYIPEGTDLLVGRIVGRGGLVVKVAYLCREDEPLDEDEGGEPETEGA